MALSQIRRLLRSNPKAAGAAARSAFRPRSYHPRLEFLEDRCLPSAVLLVDDDKRQCPNAKYTSINMAIQAAQPGDTIEVCPGLYSESVLVNKTVRILAHPGEADRNPSRTPNPTSDAIVQPPVPGTSGFMVTANDVAIDGFVVQGATGNAGINLDRQHSGYQIRDNLIRDNSFGLYLNSNGAHSTAIADNAFVDNNRAGAAAGNGIYSDQGVSNARITGNFFTRQTNAAMIFVGDGSALQDQFNLLIAGNNLQKDAPIIMVNAHDSAISGNVSVGSAGSGIFFGGNVHNVEVSYNVLKDGAFTGINLRTNAFGNAPQVNSNNRIIGNYVSGFGDSGIRLREGAANNLVAGNRVLGNGTLNDPTTGDGISPETGAHDNVVRDNVANDNRQDGIHADSTTKDNRIVHNTMLHNGKFDARDDSVGTRTAGTANVWEHNFCETESRPGLCEHKKHGDHDGDHDGEHDHDD